MKNIKMILIVFIIFIIPVMAFSDVAIGGAAFKNIKNFDNTNLFENLSYGINGRFRFGTLQLDAVGLYNKSDTSKSIDLIFDAEGNFDFLILNISGGIGPNFIIPINDSSGFTYGINAKVNLDIRIFKKLTIGFSYIYLIDDIAQKQGSSTSRSLIGATVLIW